MFKSPNLIEAYTDVPVAPPQDTDEHCHWTHAQPPSAIPQLVVALVLCMFFMICEVIGGYLAGSLSIMCDAAHMLSDCGGFALALLAFHCAKRRPDVLGAMVSVLLIWVLTGVFVYVAAVRLHTGDYSIEPDMMMIVSGCGVAFNVILAIVLHGCASDVGELHYLYMYIYSIEPDMMLIVSGCGVAFNVILAIVLHGCASDVGELHYLYMYIYSIEPDMMLIVSGCGVAFNVILAIVLHGCLSDVGELHYLYMYIYSIEPDMMLIVSGCGVAFNVILAIVLHGCASDVAHHHTHGGAACSQHAHAHAHAHEHDEARFRLFRRERKQNGALVNGDYTMKDLSSNEASMAVASSSTRNINLRAALIHVIGDLIQSCGCVSTLSALSGVRHVHSLHVWALSSHYTVLSAHLAIVRVDAVGAERRAARALVARVGALLALHRALGASRYRYCVSALSGVRHVHSLHVWALSSHYTVLSAHLAIVRVDAVGAERRAARALVARVGALLALHRALGASRYRYCVSTLSALSGVRHVHSLHVWALSSHYTRIARSDFGVQSATFQIERYSPRMLSCTQCREQPAIHPPHPTTLSH
ncbi:putative Zn2+ transporter [Operophtera brumata]|uniref:Putative Zn2+ transporter n=1 Tax=Operophtera brumata TaxID=104452 RepID=A0A0L7L9F6_OPEBR|nr:putative Zn2+ transporter [Operophtera brumata]